VPGYNPTDFGRWLRHRRAIRSVRSGGPGASPGDPDVYDADGREIEHDPREYAGCLALLLIAVVFLFGVVFWVCNPFGGGDANIIGSPTIATTTGSTTSTIAGATTTAVPTTTTSAPGIQLPNPIGSIVGPLGFNPTMTRRQILDDLLADLIDSISENDPGHRGREIDIVDAIILWGGVSETAVNLAFNNSTYECDARDPLVVCADDLLPMPAGDILVVAVQHDDIVPQDSTERSYIYALVFESDGDTANDWVFNPPFDWDLFQGADRWYQTIYSHTTGEWAMSVIQLDDTGTPGPDASSVRVVIQGPWVVWFVPAAEIPDFPGRFRATAFAHDGQFTAATRGADVTGANPTEPMFDPEAAPDE
jgi:hypothetical protein